MAEMTSILLRNATILVPNANDDDHVVPLRSHSLLIEGRTIARIAPHIEPPSQSTNVIDCSGKILCPGFIDTHHHVWQTQLKGRHADQTLIEYIPSGNMQCYNYTAEDVLWGQLGGLLEALNAGTTTVVDHAHMNFSEEHSAYAIAATVSSGIRSIFCYTPTARVKQWEPTLTMNEELVPDWAVEQLEGLAKAAPFGDGRVHVGLGFDALYLPEAVVTQLFDRCRKAGTKLITSHYARGAVFGQHSIVDMIDEKGLLGPDILISHASNLTEADGKKLQEAHASISCTPDTELQMGLGYPVCFRDDVKSICSLGVDCHSNNGASMVNQMRLGLQAERGRRNELIVQQGKAPRQLDTSVNEVFQLSTIKGARAVNMQDQIGSLEKGKLADIMIFDGQSPGMVCAAEEDPVAAIVLHSSVADIDTVIIDGKIRKDKGSLMPVSLEVADTGFKPEKTHLEWKDISGKLSQSRQSIIKASKENWSGDLHRAVDDLVKAFRIGDSLV